MTPQRTLKEIRISRQPSNYQYEKYRNKLNWLFPTLEGINQGGGMALNYFFPGVGSAAASLVSNFINIGQKEWQNRLDRIEKYRTDYLNSPKKQMQRLMQTGINPNYLINRVDSQIYEPLYQDKYPFEDPSQSFSNYARGMQSLSMLPLNFARTANTEQQTANAAYILANILPQTKESNDLSLINERIQSEWNQGHLKQVLSEQKQWQDLQLQKEFVATAEFLKMHTFNYQGQDVNLTQREDGTFRFEVWAGGFSSDGTPVDGAFVPYDLPPSITNEYCEQTVRSWILLNQKLGVQISEIASQAALNYAQKGLTGLKSSFQVLYNEKQQYIWNKFLETGVWIDSDPMLMRAIAGSDPALAQYLSDMGIDIAKIVPSYMKAIPGMSKPAPNIYNYGNRVKYYNKSY